MLSIQKHQSKLPPAIALNYFLNQGRDMYLSSILSKCMFIISLLSVLALICLSAASSNKASKEKLNNNPGRYSRGYGYHGHMNGQVRPKDRKGRQRHELSLPRFQVIIKSIPNLSQNHNFSEHSKIYKSSRCCAL